MRDPGPGGASAIPDSKSDAYTQRLEGAFTKLEKNADRAVKDFKRLVKKVNEASQQAGPVATAAAPFTGGASLLAPAALYLVEKHLDDIWAHLQKLMKRAEYAMKHETPVVSLVYASFAWVDNAMNPLSRLTGDAKLAADHDLVRWKADAATVYATVRGDQVAALQEVTKRAKGVSTWLMEVAEANTAFVTALAAAVGKIAAKLGVAVAEISTAVEAPWGIDTLADAIAEMVAEFFQWAARSANELVKTLGDVLELYSLRQDEEYFPGKKWPQAVTI